MQKPSVHIAGFSMMELLIVLLIGSLAVGLLGPRVGAGYTRMQDRTFLGNFVREIKHGRLRAMETGKIVEFRLRGAERLFGNALPLGNTIPDNVDIFVDEIREDEGTGDSIITCWPDGGVDEVELDIIFDNDRKYILQTDPILGFVSVSQDRES
jgi:general secretion pathway protein H